MIFDVHDFRAQFPSMNLTVGGNAAIFFDGPGGTQTPRRVIDAISSYLTDSNANAGGHFLTSERNDAMIAEARGLFADFMGCKPEEVSFCHNSTTISFKLAQAIARDFQPGDEVILTEIDHEANRGPWEMLQERGIVLRSIRVVPETCTLDLEHYKTLLSPRTKVVAFNYASNAVGTINDAKAIVELAQRVGALTIADAVHFALHGQIDVRAIGVDFLFCSAYKFFGPHLGVLYARHEAMEKLRTLRVGAQKPAPPEKFETGTLNHEGIAGAAEAIRFLADMGARFSTPVPASRRQRILAAMHAFEEHEQPLARTFRKELATIKGLTLYGPPEGHPCTSTIAFRLAGLHPREVSTALGKKGIFTWNGNFYAVQLVRALGLHETGGLVRIGLAPYNTKAEIDRTLEVLQALSSGAK